MRLKQFNDYIIKDDYAIIFINSNRHGLKECLVDIDILNKLLKLPYTWHLSPVGKRESPDRTFYAVCHAPYRRETRSKKLYLQDLVMNHNPSLESGYVVDYKNHNGLDNRRENLRKVTQAINILNRKGAQYNNPTRVLGVQYDKRLRKYRARITVNKQEIYLGLFIKLEDAHIAVQDYRRNILANADQT